MFGAMNANRELSSVEVYVCSEQERERVRSAEALKLLENKYREEKKKVRW